MLEYFTPPHADSLLLPLDPPVLIRQSGCYVGRYPYHLEDFLLRKHELYRNQTLVLRSRAPLVTFFYSKSESVLTLFTTRQVYRLLLSCDGSVSVLSVESVTSELVRRSLVEMKVHATCCEI